MGLVVTSANASLVSFTFTTEALGLGTQDINKGGSVSPDRSGIFTSTTPGQGSVLQVQTSGLAGPGTDIDPLLFTVTAQTRLDTLYGIPSDDYRAGILYISNQDSHTPDGAKEGLGVRAFTVDSITGLRRYHQNGLAVIQGNKHISGGTGLATYLLQPNGPPHVDESIRFDFNSNSYVKARSIDVLLSDVKTTSKGKGNGKGATPGQAKLDLHIQLTSGQTVDISSVQLDNSPLTHQVDPSYDKLWSLSFAEIANLGANDYIDHFEIRAIDPLISGQAKKTAEHFLITGFTGTIAPEPATILLLTVGALFLRRRNHKKRSPKKHPASLP